MIIKQEIDIFLVLFLSQDNSDLIKYFIINYYLKQFIKEFRNFLSKQ